MVIWIKDKKDKTFILNYFICLNISYLFYKLIFTNLNKKGSAYFMLFMAKFGHILLTSFPKLSKVILSYTNSIFY